MGKNQACQSQVHVTALRCLRVKIKKRGINRRIKPILRGGAGSYTLPNHVIGKRMVNKTLVKAEGSSCSDPGTARNLLTFHTIAVRQIKTVNYYF